MSAINFLNKIGHILSSQQILHRAEDTELYRLSPRGFYEHKLTAVLLPETTQQVAAIMRAAYETKTSIIPQGGNTGLVGAQQGVVGQENIVLSLKRMDKIINIDAANFTVLLEAGVILENLHAELGKRSLYFPLQLASQGSCCIGGNLSTNAGGTAVLAYGSMRDLCLGLEVVLPDGRVLNDLRFVKKDNSGYDLKNLFIGAEGTLGIITKAVLKLWPQPRQRQFAYIACENLKQVLAVFAKARQAFGQELEAYELLSDFAMQLSLQYLNKTSLFTKQHAWYVLLGLACLDNEAKGHLRLEDLLQNALAVGLIQDAVVAQNQVQENYFWQLRENVSAAQKHVGVSIKNDISVPINNMVEFLKFGASIVAQHCPTARIVCFGHIGDGNLHYNILVPAGYTAQESAEFLDLWQPISAALNTLVVQLGGSIAAEHGIGQLKRSALEIFKDPVAYTLMLSIKQQLDPHNIMNPHKILNL